MKDWVGNNKAIFSCHGASNHSVGDRQNEDYYATDPNTIDDLLKHEQFSVSIWENASGENHLADRLKSHGHTVRCSDIIKRTPQTELIDFLKYEGNWHGDIVTNPPYKYAEEWVWKSMECLKEGSKLAMFLKLTFLEGQKRRKMFEVYPPKTVYVYSKRAMCAKNGDFKNTDGSAVAYAWYVWEKGFSGNTVLKWV